MKKSLAMMLALIMVCALPGIASANGGGSINGAGITKDAVFIELQRRGCEIYYFSEKYECDFLVKENLDITEAIQVTYGLNAENAHREIGGLAEAMQTFNIPKGTLIVVDNTVGQQFIGHSDCVNLSHQAISFGNGQLIRIGYL